MSAAPTNIPDCLRTEVCPNCAYALKGSPPVGACPECGQPFNQSEIILYGWARGKHENPGNAKASRLVWVLVLAILAIAPSAFQAWFLSPHGSKSFPLLLIVVAFLMVDKIVLMLDKIVMLFRRHKTDHPGLIQVRLSEAGCVQYDAVAGPSMIFELSKAHGWFIPILGIMCLYGICAFGWLPLPFFWFLSPFFLLAAFYRWFPCRRFRQELRHAREGANADRNAALHSIVPWNQALNFSLRPVRKRIQRLRIARPAWRRFQKNCPVDARNPL